MYTKNGAVLFWELHSRAARGIVPISEWRTQVPFTGWKGPALHGRQTDGALAHECGCASALRARHGLRGGEPHTPRVRAHECAGGAAHGRHSTLEQRRDAACLSHDDDEQEAG